MRRILYALAAFLLAVNLLSASLPQPAYAVICDCDADSDCSPGQECDEGASAGCDRVSGAEGLCKTTSGGGNGGEKVDEIPVGNLSDLPFQDIFNYGIGAAVLLAVLLLVVGGFGVATSAGNPDNLEKAKQQITAAISGLVFILLAWTILSIIGGGIIGIDFFK